MIQEKPVTLVMGWIDSLNIHLNIFSFGMNCIFDCFNALSSHH